MNGRSALATFGEFARNGLGVPVLVMAVLAMMVLPLPAFLLDVFFTFNITLSLMILLAVVFTLIVQWNVPKWTRLPAIPAIAKVLAGISILLWLGSILAGTELPALTGLG